MPPKGDLEEPNLLNLTAFRNKGRSEPRAVHKLETASLAAKTSARWKQRWLSARSMVILLPLKSWSSAYQFASFTLVRNLPGTPIGQSFARARPMQPVEFQ